MNDSRPADPERPGGRSQLDLILFIHQTSHIGMRSTARLRRYLEREYSGQYDLDVIDVFRNLDAVRKYRVLATPCLVRLRPVPTAKLIGDFSTTDTLTTFLADPNKN